jgi:RNA polymerase sigma-70 factor, ECF subfamily
MTRGDCDILEIAVREHSRMVYRIAYSVLRNHHDAEDATQDVFLRVLRYRRKLEGVHDQKTWMARIAWRVAVDRKKAVPETKIDEPDLAIDRLRSSLTSADDLLISSETVTLLESLISGLPRQLRDVITLATVQELSITEVAAVLEMPEATIRSRLFRARQMLKEKLESLTRRQHGTRED